MMTRKRLLAVKAWADSVLCEGKLYKSPSADGDITKTTMQRPQVFVAWQPRRPDSSGLVESPVNVCPSITIMPVSAYGQYVEEKRFDRFNNVHRAQEMGQGLNVDMLFSIYEPGIRLDGFTQYAEEHGGRIDVSKIAEGTEEGLFTLTDWMDEAMDWLLGHKFIPNSDLFLDETKLVYSLYTDQSYVVDKRPIFYGFVRACFNGYSRNGSEEIVDDILNNL